ncbi:MAG: Nif3-like dinuclear metal center hexameric protein [Desulfobacter sp.]|nr:MAG: Nif3-like dinuclear metal center hexameric protein [Desulfobacter sp.]
MSQPTVNHIIDVINDIAPFSLAENWDNSGLQAGDPDWAVTGILVALDVSREVMETAVEAGCSMVVTHHPLVMAPEKSLDFSRMPGAIIYTAAKHDIAVVSAHTNLDKARDGLNDYFAQKLGIQCEGPLFVDSAATEERPTGIGRTGRLSSPMAVGDLAAIIKTQLNTPFVRLVGDTGRKAYKVALCTGSGGSLTENFLKSDADVYITGDLKYHEARDIETAGRICIDVGHFASERIVVDMLTHRLKKELKLRDFEVKILGYNREKDPFRII